MIYETPELIQLPNVDEVGVDERNNNCAPCRGKN